MKKIAITMGDPGGVGPEIIVESLAIAGIRKICLPFVIGDRVVMEEALRLVKSPLKLKIIKTPDEMRAERNTAWLIDIGSQRRFKKGMPAAGNGMASAGYIKKAVRLALDKKIDGIVTAPISKEAMKMAGMKWPGHTEMLAELTETKDYAMMLAGGPLKVILVTIHASLKSVAGLITRKRVFKTILLAKKACDMMRIKKPRIAVAGLNPHAGESGIFGDEEVREIVPAVEKARAEGILVSGPFPPDTLFHRAYKGAVDIIVCMYHDQGLIPLKMIAFDKGVNVTIGLPIIRTSPDHGTAYDIAWKGIANPSSMIEAIKLAARLKI